MLALGLGFGRRGSDRARMFQELPPGHLQELIQLGDPVAHSHGLALEGLQLGVLDVQAHDAVQHLQLGLAQVVLRHRRIGLVDDAAGPRGLHTH